MTLVKQLQGALCENVGGDAYVHPALVDKLVPIDTIRPHPDNPRVGDQEAITASIRDLGLYKPITVQRSTGRILAGNHTYAGMLELGATQIPVTYLDVDDDALAKAILLRDNHVSDDATYDDGLLLQLLAEISDAGQLPMSGFTDDDTVKIMQRIESFGDDAASFLNGFGAQAEGGDPEPPIVGQTPEGEIYYQLQYTVTKDHRDLVNKALTSLRHELSTDDHRATTAECLVELARRHLKDAA